jgi:hypothetical protein
MRVNKMNLFWAVAVLGLNLSIGSTPGQEVLIPDPALNAAVHETLGVTSGPLTQQDLLSLSNLTARNRNIRSLQGLDAWEYRVNARLV